MGIDRLVDLVEQARFNKIPLHMAAFRNVVQVNGIAVLGICRYKYIYIYIYRYRFVAELHIAWEELQVLHDKCQICLQVFALSL